MIPRALKAMVDALSPTAAFELERVLNARLYIQIQPARQRENELGALIELIAVHGPRAPRKTYDEQWREGTASSRSLVKKHGTWIRACRAAATAALKQANAEHAEPGAGLKALRAWPNLTSGKRRPSNYTSDEVIRAVLACAGEIGRLPTSNAYYDWAAQKRARARQNGTPPPRIPTQRSVERHYAGWSQVRRAVHTQLESQPEMPERT